MKFWKEHASLRLIIIAVFFVLGLGFGGFGMPGKLSGLGIMIVGVIFLLAALMIYNKPFEDPKR